MEKQKSKFGLLAKVIFTVAFVAVFVVNMVMVVQKDDASGKLTLSSLKSYAQTVEGGELPPVNITCASYGSNGRCFVIASNSYQCNCEYTGITVDYCDDWVDAYCECYYFGGCW